MIHQSKLSWSCNFDWLPWCALTWSCLCFNLFNNCLSFNHSSKDDMFSIKMRGRNCSNEELGTISIFTCISHWQKEWYIMLMNKVFISKFLSVDWFTSSSIVICEVTSLKHKVCDHSVETAACISETFFSRTKCSEVCSGLWYFFIKKLENNSSKVSPSHIEIKIDFWHI